MIVSTSVLHSVKICQVLMILHQLICTGVANFGTWWTPWSQWFWTGEMQRLSCFFSTKFLNFQGPFCFSRTIQGQKKSIKRQTELGLSVIELGLSVIEVRGVANFGTRCIFLFIMPETSTLSSPSSTLPCNSQREVGALRFPTFCFLSV